MSIPTPKTVKEWVSEGRALIQNCEESTVTEFFAQLQEGEKEASQSRKLYRLALGQVILEWSAKTGQSWEESISQLSKDKAPPEFTLSLKSMMKYPRIVNFGLSGKVMANDAVTITHLEEITSCAGPEEPDKRAGWVADCGQLLAKIIDNDGMSKAETRSRMRELQKKHGVEPKRQVGSSALLKDYVQLFRVLLLPADERDAAFKLHDVTYQDVKNSMILIEDQLVQRGEIPNKPADHPIPKA